MINYNSLSEAEVIISESEDIAGEPISVTTKISIKGLLSHGSTGTNFSVDRDTISLQDTFITFDDFPKNAIYLYCNGFKYSISGIPQKWEAPKNFSIKTGTVVNLTKVLNG